MRDANQDRQPEKPFDPIGGRFPKDYGADHQRLQISDLHFDKFPTPAPFACWKIRFKTEVCTCSQFPTEATLRIKEVEMVQTIDDLKSSRSIKGTLGLDFELLDARIFSALNKNHPEQPLQEKCQSGGKESSQRRPLPPRKTDSLPDLRILPGYRTNDSVEKYADLFTILLRHDDIQEFDSKWEGIWLSMTNIPPNDMLEGLYKLRIRESEKLKTDLELYDLEIHQKKIGLDYHRLEMMVKRSIAQDTLKPEKDIFSFCSNHFCSNLSLLAKPEKCWLGVLVNRNRCPRNGWTVLEVLNGWYEVLRGPPPPSVRWPMGRGQPLSHSI